MIRQVGWWSEKGRKKNFQINTQLKQPLKTRRSTHRLSGWTRFSFGSLKRCRGEREGGDKER